VILEGQWWSIKITQGDTQASQNPDQLLVPRIPLVCEKANVREGRVQDEEEYMNLIKAPSIFH